MSNDIQIVAKVTSGGMLNIPRRIQEMNNIEKDDLLELTVTRHKKPDEEQARELTTEENNG